MLKVNAWSRKKIMADWQSPYLLHFANSKQLLGLTLLFSALFYWQQPCLRQSLRAIALWLTLFWLFIPLPPLLAQYDMPASAAIAQQLLPFLTGLILLRLWIMIVFRQWLHILRFTPPSILEDIVLALAYVGWVLFRLRAAGLDLSQIVVTSTVITAILAFAMQDTLGNILAGLALQWDATFQTGDWIKVDDVQGQVIDINWRATFLETRNGETVVLPNSQLTRNRVMLLGKRRGQPLQWRRWIYFEVTLETLPTQIIQLVEGALQESQLPCIAANPPPQCLLMAVDKGVGRFALRYWLTNLQEDDPTDSLLRTAIDAALRRQGRRLSPPQYNMLITYDDNDYSQRRHLRHAGERLAALRRLELFAPLNEDELLLLADQLKFTPYVAGEPVLRQGQEVDWLYILIRGELEQTSTTPDGVRHLLPPLRAGSFFGEISLLTGEPSPLTISALGNAECYRLEWSTFQQLLLARDELSDAFSQVLSRRLQQRVQLLEAAAVPSGPPPQQGEILDRLRTFFGLSARR